MAFKPTTFKNVDLVIGDAVTSTQFKCQLKSVKLIPEVNIIKEKTACPTGVYTEAETPEWSLEIGHLTGVDEATATKALTEYLRVNSGEVRSVAFRPISGSVTGGFKMRCRMVATEIGGAVGGMNTATVQLPVEGQPIPLTEDEDDEDSPAVWS